MGRIELTGEIAFRGAKAAARFVGEGVPWFTFTPDMNAEAKLLDDFTERANALGKAEPDDCVSIDYMIARNELEMRRKLLSGMVFRHIKATPELMAIWDEIKKVTTNGQVLRVEYTPTRAAAARYSVRHVLLDCLGLDVALAYPDRLTYGEDAILAALGDFAALAPDDVRSLRRVAKTAGYNRILELTGTGGEDGEREDVVIRAMTDQVIHGGRLGPLGGLDMFRAGFMDAIIDRARGRMASEDHEHNCPACPAQDECPLPDAVAYRDGGHVRQSRHPGEDAAEGLALGIAPGDMPPSFFEQIWEIDQVLEGANASVDVPDEPATPATPGDSKEG